MRDADGLEIGESTTTPLMVACLFGSKAIANLFIHLAQADYAQLVRAKNGRGDTAASLAKKNVDFAQGLVDE